MNFYKKTAIILSSTVLCLSSINAFAIDAPKWSHNPAEQNGPAHWGKLDNNYGMCEAGQAQSPINIISKDSVQANLPAFAPRYEVSGYKVLDNWRMIQVTAPTESAGFLNFKNANYRLVMIHFHTPAETAIDGKQAPMSIHLIHSNTGGQRTIIMVNVVEGKANPAVEQILNKLPKDKGEETTLAGNFDPTQLLPENRDYFYYTGSITIPPCIERAQWIVLQTPITMSKAQIQAFGERYQQNVRPLQPLNGRVVERSQ